MSEDFNKGAEAMRQRCLALLTKHAKRFEGTEGSWGEASRLLLEELREEVEQFPLHSTTFADAAPSQGGGWNKVVPDAESR